MIYRIAHTTTYKYTQAVAVGNHVACLTPRSRPQHHCTWSALSITPSPVARNSRVDYFGNQITLFTVQEPHKELVVEARSEVTITNDIAAWPKESVAWEQAVRFLSSGRGAEALDAYQFVFDSPRVRVADSFASYARRSFTPGRPFAEAFRDLTSRIYNDFRFDAKATNVRTTPEEVFRRRRGVCQDFAHVQIACLRSLNLAARYVSGYLRTFPPEGAEKLVGADVSHAWVSAYCPGAGWLDADPTNDVIPTDSHVTLAWGRDYGDVSPLRGVILGGRNHTLDVKVHMQVAPGSGR